MRFDTWHGIVFILGGVCGWLIAAIQYGPL